MLNVTQRQDTDLSSEEVLAVVSLLNSIWPSEAKTIPEVLDEIVKAANRHAASYPETERPSLRYLVWDEGDLLAHALTFERRVITRMGEIPVMALAGVCVAPSHRRRGLGEEIVRRAFKRIDDGEFPVALFQTAIPAFYERLNATPVRNKFLNTTNKAAPNANPWHDPWVMIYSTRYSWPDGPIDLNGPGY